MTPDDLRARGWRLIASEAHAAQLLRREVKHHAAWQQRCPAFQWDLRRLLSIKKGNWYKFLRNSHNGHCSILTWRLKDVQREDEGT